MSSSKKANRRRRRARQGSARFVLPGGTSQTRRKLRRLKARQAKTA